IEWSRAGHCPATGPPPLGPRSLPLLLAVRHVPEPDVSVNAPRGQYLATRTEGYRLNSLATDPHGGLQSPRAWVPKLNLPVPASRGQDLAVRAEGHGFDILTIAPCPEGDPLLTTGQVPEVEAAGPHAETHLFRGPSRRQGCPVRAEGD